MNNKNGFTLVELLVSATVLAIALIAVISAVRKGVDISTNDLHRRQAKTMIVNRLELPTYQKTNWSNLCKLSNPYSDSLKDTLDLRSVPLIGMLTTTIIRDSLPINVVKIARIKIIISMSWSEPGYTDSIRIEKWLSEL